MSESPFRVGELVSIARWDASSPWRRVHALTATVLGIEYGQVCRSGIMIRMKDSLGRKKRLDQGWIDKINQPKYAAHEK